MAWMSQRISKDKKVVALDAESVKVVQAAMDSADQQFALKREWASIREKVDKCMLSK